MKKQIPTIGTYGRLSQAKLQTNQPKGTYTSGDAHPDYPSIIYRCFRTPNQIPSHGGGEHWSLLEKYEKFKDKSRKWSRDCQALRQGHISDYKQEKGCTMCGYNAFAQALDLDHIDPSTKTKENDTNKLRYKSLNKIIKFLKSGIYQVLCANCHRVKTYEDTKKRIKH